jgi:Tol biopolymer transport system component
LPILRTQSWSFQVAETGILYLWPDGGRADLYTRALDGDETTRLTETPHGVLDFDLSPDGRKILYAAVRQGGGSELRELEIASRENHLVYECPQPVRCQALTYSADGEMVAFERFNISQGASGKSLPGRNRVWGLRLSELGEAFPIGIADHVTSTPQWSPTGRLAYYDATLRAIALVDVHVGPEPTPINYIPNDLGLVGSWSPDGQAFVYAAIVFPQAEFAQGAQSVFYSHLYRMNINSGQIVDLTEEEVGLVEDASPVFSPDGKWIAFTRKYLEDDRWTLGRQLWIMHPDGSGVRQLTDDADYHVASIVWSPDSGSLAYVRKNQMDINEPVETWWIDIDSEEAKRLVTGGYSPQWLP